VQCAEKYFVDHKLAAGH